MRLPQILLISVLTVMAGTALAAPHLTPTQSPAQRFSPLESGDALAQGEFPKQRGTKQRGRILRSLNLSRTQLQQLWAVRSQYQPTIRDRSRQVRAAKAELRQLLASTADASEVKAQFQQLQQLRQELQQLRLQSVLATREILTPEQRQSFAEQMEQRRLQRNTRL